MKTAINSTLLNIAIGLSVSSALFAQVPTYTASTLMGNYSTTDPSTNSPVVSPYAVAVDANGNVFFTDTIGNRVRRVDATTGAITTVAGDGTLATGTYVTGTTQGSGGPATKAKLWQPVGLAFDSTGNLYIADSFNHTIDKVDTNGVFTIYAGIAATSGYTGSGLAAVATRLRNPQRIAVDAQGNLYIADKENNRIRKVTTDGVMHEIAGIGGNSTTTAHAFSGDGGPAGSAGLGQPQAVAVDSFGNVYIADTASNRIRVISVTGPTGISLGKSDSTRIITTVAGGGTAAQVDLGAGLSPLTAILSAPGGLAVDANNNVYIADTGNSRILYLNNNFSTCSGTPAVCGTAPSLSVVASGTVSGITLASGAVIGGTSLSSPNGLALSGTKLYIANTGGNNILVYDVVANTITTLVQGSPTPFNAPHGVTVSPSGAVYVADTANQRITSIAKGGGSMTQIAGITGKSGLPPTGGDENPFNPVSGVNSSVSSPWGGAFDLNGNFYFADRGNHRVRMVSPAGVISTVAGGLTTLTQNINQGKSVQPVNSVALSKSYQGDGSPAVEGGLNSPSAVAIDNVGGTNACPTAPCLYIADTSNNAIRQVNASGVMTTFAGMAPSCAATVGLIVSGTPQVTGCPNLTGGYYGDGLSAVLPFDPSEVTTTTTTVVNAVTGTTTSVSITSSPAPASTLSGPLGVAVDASGNVYIADSGNSALRVVNSTTLLIDTVVASNTLDSPTAVAVAPDGGVIVAEGCVTQNSSGSCTHSRIDRYDPKAGTTAQITAYASATPLSAGSYADSVASTKAISLVPTGVAVGPDGTVYFTDATNRVRALAVSH